MTLLPTPVGASHAREPFSVAKPFAGMARSYMGLLGLSLLLSGCAIGPDYQRPLL